MLRTVTEVVNGRETVMQISGVPGRNVIPVRHEDTKDLAVGRYSADIQPGPADGLRKTVWPDFEAGSPKRWRMQNMKNLHCIGGDDAVIQARNQIVGMVGAGPMIVNDWAISVEKIEGGQERIARRGTEEQVHKNSAGYARIGEKIAGAIIREFGN